MTPPAALRIHLLLVAALGAGCSTSRPSPAGPGNGKQPKALGSFALASPRVGDATLALFACEAGDRQRFLGADFPDERAGVVLRLVVDPLAGPAVRIFATDAPFDRSLVFRRDECRTFRFSLGSTGWRINDVQDYRVSLELDCERDGQSIRGQLSTDHCH